MNVSPIRLAEVFVEVADTLIEEFDLIEFLLMLADRVAGLTDDTTVGILLADPKDRLHFMAASEESAKLLELFQLQHQDGPCLDAFHSGQPVVNTDLTVHLVREPPTPWVLLDSRTVVAQDGSGLASSVLRGEDGVLLGHAHQSLFVAAR